MISFGSDIHPQSHTQLPARTCAACLAAAAAADEERRGVGEFRKDQSAQSFFDNLDSLKIYGTEMRRLIG